MCQICGKETTVVGSRWFKYDNGEQFLAALCLSCAEMHSRLVGA